MVLAASLLVLARYVRSDARLEANTPIETVAQHLGYLVERMGDDHVALGSDFDGAVMPLAIKDASHLPNLIAYGFNEATLRKIALDRRDARRRASRASPRRGSRRIE
jgi:microsomal dipeptidase-like Zn-dependent dipeptidase